jgi:hypothetical protein
LKGGRTIPERIPCEFFLIRYVPDAVKGEFTNIGVLLREAGRGRCAVPAAQVRFTRDWSRVRCMDADADIGLLEALEGEIDARLRLGPSLPAAKPLIAVIEDSFSNSIQMSEAARLPGGERRRGDGPADEACTSNRCG